MRLAILSDTHSRYATVEKALKISAGRGADLLLHCGDIDDSDTVWLFPANTHFVFGNCDLDRHSLRQAMHGIGATVHEPFGSLELERARLAFVHGDDRRLFHQLEHSGDYNYLFYGHSHIAEEHQTGPTRVINPGALHRAARKMFAILDLETGEVDSVEVE